MGIAHSLIYCPVPTVVHAAESNMREAVATIQQLAQVASNHPYYRFNYSWQRQIESSVGHLSFYGPVECAPLIIRRLSISYSAAFLAALARRKQASC